MTFVCDSQCLFLLVERRAALNDRKTDNAAENIRNYIVIRIGIYYNFFIIELRREADENI